MYKGKNIQTLKKKKKKKKRKKEKERRERVKKTLKFEEYKMNDWSTYLLMWGRKKLSFTK